MMRVDTRWNRDSFFCKVFSKHTLRLVQERESRWNGGDTEAGGRKEETRHCWDRAAENETKRTRSAPRRRIRSDSNVRLDGLIQRTSSESTKCFQLQKERREGRKLTMRMRMRDARCDAEKSVNFPQEFSRYGKYARLGGRPRADVGVRRLQMRQPSANDILPTCDRTGEWSCAEATSCPRRRKSKSGRCRRRCVNGMKSRFTGILDGRMTDGLEYEADEKHGQARQSKQRKSVQRKMKSCWRQEAPRSSTVWQRH